MVIKKLILNNFRSYKKFEINFTKNINIIIGENGAGKTNILESVYMLGISKSFLTNNDDELIYFGSDYYFIKGSFYLHNKNKLLQISYQNKNKNLKINNNIIKKKSEYLSKLNIVLFSSIDLNIIKGQPNDKRKFLNVEISQISNEYLNCVNIYNKILKQRNEYIKSIYKESDLDLIYYEIITNELINISKKIIEHRINFIKQINSIITNIYNNISQKNNKLELIYVPTLNYHNTNELILQEYKKNIKNELKYKTTNLGVHRDSFKICLDNNDANLYASSGQQRLCIIALKLAEVEIFKNVTKDFPIVILDDIFSELDEAKQNMLISNLNSNIQVILTTTDINDMNSKLRKKAKIFTIRNSEIVEVIENGKTI